MSEPNIQPLKEIARTCRNAITRMIATGNQKVQCSDYYIPSEEAMDATILDALRKAHDTALAKPVTKEGWMTEHPTTGEQVEVVTTAWAHTALAKQEERISELELSLVVIGDLAVRAIRVGGDSLKRREIVNTTLALQPAAHGSGEPSESAAGDDSKRLDYLLSLTPSINATKHGNFYLPETREGIDAALESKSATPPARTPTAPVETGEQELKRCPFCGGDNVHITTPHGGDPVHYVAICTPSEEKSGCGASSTWKRTHGEAVAAWNQRVIEEYWRAKYTQVMDTWAASPVPTAAAAQEQKENK